MTPPLHPPRDAGAESFRGSGKWGGTWTKRERPGPEWLGQISTLVRESSAVDVISMDGTALAGFSVAFYRGRFPRGSRSTPTRLVLP